MKHSSAVTLLSAMSLCWATLSVAQPQTGSGESIRPPKYIHTPEGRARLAELSEPYDKLITLIREELKQGKYVLAEKHCHMAMQYEDPKVQFEPAMAKLYLADSIYRQKRYAEAIEAYKKCKTMSQNFQANYVFCYLNLNQEEKAWQILFSHNTERNEFSELTVAPFYDELKAHPTRNRLWAATYLLHTLFSERREQLQDLDEALKLVPKDPCLMYKKASCLNFLSTGNYPIVKPLFEHAIAHTAGELRKYISDEYEARLQHFQAWKRGHPGVERDENSPLLYNDL